jgi:hypothetical protein
MKLKFKVKPLNTFCATGPGGGVNPHCSPSQGGGVGGGPKGNTVVQKVLPGSTKPELVVDENGEKWVKKSGRHGKEDHVKNEFDADQAYRALGVPTPFSVLNQEGKVPTKYSKFIDGATELGTWMKTASSAEQKAMFEQIGKNFVADALLANWDAVGMGKNNILIKDGVAYRIDNGGALKYRAQGTPKGDAFTPSVGELQTMRDPSKNPDSAQVFGFLTDDAIKEQIHDILGKKQAVLDAVKDPDTKMKLSARFKYLQMWAGKPEPKIDESKAQHDPLQEKLYFGELKAGDVIKGSVSGNPYPIKKVTKSGEHAMVEFKNGSTTAFPWGGALKSHGYQHDIPGDSGVKTVGDIKPGMIVKQKTGTAEKVVKSVEPSSPAIGGVTIHYTDGTKLIGVNPNASLTEFPNFEVKPATIGSKLAMEKALGVHTGDVVTPPWTNPSPTATFGELKPGNIMFLSDKPVVVKSVEPHGAGLLYVHYENGTSGVYKASSDIASYGYKTATKSKGETIEAALKAEVPKPVPKNYGELYAGYKYVNSQGKTKEVESVKDNGDTVTVSFKGEPGSATLPKTKSMPSPAPAPTPEVTSPAATYEPVAPGEVKLKKGDEGAMLAAGKVKAVIYFDHGLSEEKPVDPNAPPAPAPVYTGPPKKIPKSVIGKKLEGADIHQLGKPKPYGTVEGSFDAANAPKTGYELSMYLKKKTGSKFTDLDHKKMSALNPEGIKDGVMLFATYNPNNSTSAPKMKLLMQHLPPGTQIKTVRASKPPEIGKYKKELSFTGGGALTKSGGGGGYKKESVDFQKLKAGETARQAMIDAVKDPTKHLTSAQHESVKKYVGHYYKQWNADMRKCPPKFECLDSSTAQHVKNVLDSFDKMPKLPELMVTKRGVPGFGPSEAAEMGALCKEAMSKGGLFQFPSITSTSPTKPWSGSLKFTIATRSGYYLKKINDHEQEYLVSPRTRFYVRGVSKEGSDTRVHLEEVDE